MKKRMKALAAFLAVVMFVSAIPGITAKADT